MNLIWATRGRSWGFRFLLDGGFDDPLEPYEAAFQGLEGESSVCRRVNDVIALRFPDPMGRRDTAGRVIPHDFVVLAPDASDVNSLEDGYRLVWSSVAHAYDLAWDAARPPTSADIQKFLQAGTSRE